MASPVAKCPEAHHPRLTLVQLTLALVLSAFARPLVAAPAALRVELVAPNDAELARRIENQVADLPVMLVSTDAEVVLLVESAASSFSLHVLELDGSGAAHEIEVRTIDVPRGGRELARSAAKESLALAARSALQALVHAREPSAETRDATAIEEKASSTPTTRVEKPAREDSRADIPFRVAVGWQSLFGGGRAPLAHGFLLRAGARSTSLRVELGLAGSIGLERTLDDGTTRVRVARHAIAIEASKAIFEAPAIELEVGVLAGLVLHRRSTDALASTAVITAPHTAPSLGLGAELRARHPLGGSPVAVELAVGVDWVPGAPVLTYSTGRERVERDALAVLQPRGSLGLSVIW